MRPALLPLLHAFLRCLLRCGLFALACMLDAVRKRCCCSSGIAWSRRPLFRRGQAAKRGKVAVVGGGIAGASCAWALARDGFDVELFEAANWIGGNAKTFLWQRDGLRTGLSVLAWPAQYFHNYQALLARLGVEHVDVRLGFHIRDPAGRDYVQGNPQSPLMQAHATGIARWQRMVRFVRSVNNMFNCCPRRASLYDLNMFNPLNVIPLRLLAACFGVSGTCWDEVIVPMYASTFLSIKLDLVPAILVPIISDIIPLTEPAILRSWKENSSLVFERMLAPDQADIKQHGGSLKVHLEIPVTSVQQGGRGDLAWTVNGTHGGFDRIVFASSAKNVRECTGALPARFRALFDGITYTQEEDQSMVVGKIHSDSSIFPFPSSAAEAKAEVEDATAAAALGGDDMPRFTREDLLRESANFIQAHRLPGGSIGYTNTFILSSWIPALRTTESADKSLPRLVTYSDYGAAEAAVKAAAAATEEQSPATAVAQQTSSWLPAADQVVGEVRNNWNHPAMSPGILGSQWLLRFIQGRRGVYFCGSLATPGNGHDLSLCSGLAVAHAMGAAYPFADSAVCKSDFDKLWGLLGLRHEK